MTKRRFILDNHMLHDQVEDKWFNSKDKAYVHMFNVICDKLDKIRDMRELKMTEPRFTYDYEDDKYYDKGFFKDNGKELYKDELLECLNNLHEENEQFKKALRLAYSTNLTEPTKNTIEQIAKHCGVDL